MQINIRLISENVTSIFENITHSLQKNRIVVVALAALVLLITGIVCFNRYHFKAKREKSEETDPPKPLESPSSAVIETSLPKSIETTLPTSLKPPPNESIVQSPPEVIETPPPVPPAPVAAETIEATLPTPAVSSENATAQPSTERPPDEAKSDDERPPLEISEKLATDGSSNTQVSTEKANDEIISLSDSLVRDACGDAQSFDQINALLKRLVNEVLENDDQMARSQVTRPFDPEKIDSQYYSRNTPLALLIKAANTEGALIILPVYETAELLETTPHGNSALHLAVVTGQMKVAYAIIARANALGLCDALVNIENHAGKTADDLFRLFDPKDKTHLHDRYLDVLEPYVGKNEIPNTSGRHSEAFFVRRTKVRTQLQEIVGPKFKTEDLRKKLSQLLTQHEI